MRLPSAIVVFFTAIVGCDDFAPTQTLDEPPVEMTATYQLPRGIKVADLAGIHEAYSVTVAQDGFHVFTINVSAENIHHVFCRLAAEVKAPAFLFLETGTHRDIEEQLRKNDTDPFHKDVYFLDGLHWTDAKSIVLTYMDLFTHDGEISYGFGAHEAHDEVYVGPYKIFSIYADEPAKYESALNELGIPKVDRVKTVWDNFGQDTPGQRYALTDVKTTIWDMIDQLKEKGLYLACTLGKEFMAVGD